MNCVFFYFKKGPEKSPKTKIVKYVPPSSFDKHSELDDVVVFKIVSKTSGDALRAKIQKVVKDHIITVKLNFVELSKEQTLTDVEVIIFILLPSYKKYAKLIRYIIYLKTTKNSY